ncbi:hypothetical protein [Neobacillus vireti]|uniref:hypothetical protein n=1 Tax=Neobacillus vireti TaxID=220686 RepID=UPI001F232247|nr:hypothetical protein [Neobacillus vireti]
MVILSFEELRMRRRALSEQSEKTLENMELIAAESKRVANLAQSSQILIDNLEKEFESQTGLNGRDIGFLFFATALQCLRQYLLTGFEERLTDDKAARIVKGNAVKESSNRLHKWYWPSFEEISLNPVPYDAQFGSPNFGLGLSGKSHRFKTLGHDPLLGWVFGTSNIVTSTLTAWDLSSYHIKTGITARGDSRDKITNRADTSKVFYYTKERLLNDGIEGKIAVGTALIKQWTHLKSDEYSKAGIPVPIINTVSPNMAQKLAEYGVDIGNIKTVGKQASMAILINTMIAMIHGLFFDQTKYNSWSVYEVKTRKILSYSNAIASASNVIYVAASAYAGNAEAVRKLDIGGLIVTIYRLVSDINFINQVKEEFIFGGFNKLIQGED